MSRAQDLACIIRSLKLIAEAGIKLQEENLKFLWKHSSYRTALYSSAIACKNSSRECPKNSSDIADIAKESAERLSTVFQGLKAYSNLSDEDQISVNKRPKLNFKTTEPSQNLSQPDLKPEEPVVEKPRYKIKLTKSDKELLRKLDMEHRAKLTKHCEEHVVESKAEQQSEKNSIQEKSKHREEKRSEPGNQQFIVTTKPNPKSKQKLSENAKQRKVPSSRIGRMVSFGTLAAGLGIGTAAEYTKRALGIGDHQAAENLFMNKANMERIVDTLCKVRGAALKLGQIMSIQDESMVNPELARALERVRKSADFMPTWQLEDVMCAELGPNWRKSFADFEDKPFAAASIGQVHQATLKDGQEVAIKIQYPGVAKGIESDIDNLGGIMKMWNIFPKGMFLENLMSVAKRELAWEVDYIREAICTRKFRELLQPYPEYYVPQVIDHVSTKQVFTTELLEGVPVDQCFDLELEHREFIGSKIMELCLLEILRFRYMQTDPNWANFLYNPSKKQLMLLDFGASREYSKPFMDQYVRILKAACDEDRQTVLEVSRDLGFLTGYESKIMEEAHVDAVMILGEVFRKDEKYDFGHQDMTYRIQHLAQIMLTQRLCPPPEEVYSLHRKLSGVFLLCSKLNISLSCRDKFMMLYNEYIRQG